MFKAAFIRIIINIIKKTSLITTITSITRVILIIETTLISTVKSKKKQHLKNLYVIIVTRSIIIKKIIKSK